MSEELKPCPFCGEREKLLPWQNDALPGMDTIICKGCEARGPHRQSLTQAELAWNTRAPTPSPSDPGETL